MTHDYKRHGTTTLFAALHVLAGTVIGRCMQRHRHIPKRPVVCFDESPHQLIGEGRQPIPAEPGQVERYDCEYKRNGTVNVFIFLDAHRPWRRVKVTGTPPLDRCRRSRAREPQTRCQGARVRHSIGVRARHRPVSRNPHPADHSMG